MIEDKIKKTTALPFIVVGSGPREKSSVASG